MINNINLTHFKNHYDSIYEFLPGINAIIGPGGCGKTSIMEAIGWAMFGTLPGKKESFEQIGYNDAGQIELSFGKHYVFKSFSGYALLDTKPDGRTIADGEMSVREAIAEILGSKRLDVLFSGLIGVTQGSIDGFFSRSNSERVKHFSKIIGIDEYKKCADWLIDAWHYIDTERIRIDSSVSRMELDDRAHRETCQDFELHCKELSDLELDKIPKLEQCVAILSDAVDNLTARLDSISEMEAEIEDIDSRLDMREVKSALASIGNHFCPECGTLVSGERFVKIQKKCQESFEKASAILERESDLRSKIEIENRLIVMSGDRIVPLREKMSVKKNELNMLSTKRNILKGTISAMESIVADNLTEKLAEGKENLNRTESVKTKLDTIRDVCRKVPAIVSESTTMEVSILATYFAKMIYPDWEVDWLRDFSITVTVGEIELPFSALSKSQKAIASLSVLLGLAKVISPVDFILLDEPFSNMDGNQVALVASAIRATGWFNQVILTTHRAEVEHIFDNVIEVEV